MKTAPRFISGIDIQSDYISIAQYSPDENAVLSVAIQPVTGTAKGLWENAGHEFKRLKQAFKFHSPDVVCSVPMEYAILKHIEAETAVADPEELIEWELSQQIIGSIEEYSYDYQECSLKNSENCKDFLAVAYRNETIRNLTAMLKGYKLNPGIVDLDVFALINVFEINYPEYKSVPSIIIHGEADKTKIIFTLEGMYLDGGCIEHSKSIETPMQYSGIVNTEINRILSFNNAFTGQPGIGLFFTGSLLSQQDFADAVAAIYGCGQLLSPFRKIECRVGGQGDKMREHASKLAVAVGLALRGNE
ncbi:MAG: pilus assembly protein PilM [Fibrobacter sp.]|nr:pilus assembly protein PilM [Fibrobacter sp.]